MKAWLACARTGPVVRRALVCALVVGPVLVAINHADAIVRGDISLGRLLSTAFHNYGEVSRAARRPAGKARRLKIPGVFEGGATQPAGMHRQPNATVIMKRST
ncbi:MAG: nitrate/nitrite transporter NrtS [Acidobacteria bacterium]|nr:nitrate/nitrite transporter NrtS [Acidobacteriota bacterium]